MRRKSISVSELKKMIGYEWVVVVVIKSKFNFFFRLPFQTWRKKFLVSLKSAIVFSVDVEINQQGSKIFIYLNELI